MVICKCFMTTAAGIQSNGRRQCLFSRRITARVSPRAASGALSPSPHRSGDRRRPLRDRASEIVGYRDRVAVKHSPRGSSPCQSRRGARAERWAPRDRHAARRDRPSARVPCPKRLSVTATPPQSHRVLALVAKACVVWLCGVAVVYLGRRLFRRWQPTIEAWFDGIVQVARGHQRVTICLAALVATVVSTYPLVFLGRSLVTPNNNALPLLYHSPPFTPGSTDVALEDVRGSDVSATIIQGLPHTSVERLALADGEVPLWNRYNASGRPLWGQGLTFMLDPLHWATLVGTEPALGWDIKFIAHRLLFAVGIGLLSLAATGGLGPSLLVASASVFGGIYSFRFNHPALFALTYAPWVLLAWRHLAQAKTRRQSAAATIGLALSTSLLLVAATPKEAAVMLVGVHARGRAHGVVFAYLVGRMHSSVVLGSRRGDCGLPRDHAALVGVLRDAWRVVHCL